MADNEYETRLKNTGRNEPCACGSGKKYKKCHLEADQVSHREALAKAAPAPAPAAAVAEEDKEKKEQPAHPEGKGHKKVQAASVHQAKPGAAARQVSAPRKTS